MTDRDLIAPGAAGERPTRERPRGPDVRAELAARYLAGSGLELAAREQPLRTSPHAHVRYLDRAGELELRDTEPGLAGAETVPVDLVDDPDTLAGIPEGSQDFVVATRLLDGLDDPVATVAAHVRTLVPGGLLFYVVAWARDRLPTFLEECRTRLGDAVELEASARDGDELVVVLSKRGGPGPPVPEAPTAAAAAEAATEALERGIELRHRTDEVQRLLASEAALMSRLLELRHADRAKRAARAARRWAAGLAARRGAGVQASAVPLSALRPVLDAGWDRDGNTWRPACRVGDTRRDALSLPGGSSARFALAVPAGCRLTGFAGLAEGSWATVASGIDARVAVRAGGGRAVAERVVALGTSRQRAPWRWERFALDLPAATELTVELAVAARDPGEESAAHHVLWGDVAFELGRLPEIAEAPEPPPAPEPPAPAGSTAAGRQDPVAAAGEPLISILMPVHDPRPEFVEAAIASVRGQSFDRWQLCVADDGSRDPAVRAAIARHAREDRRIATVRRDSGGGISVATNAALELARGEFVAMLDHDDVIADGGLEAVAAALAESPGTDVLYTDVSSILPNGRRFDPYLKPDWSPDLLRSAMYTGHLGVYRRALVEEVGGLRPELDGSQDYDLVLRLTERTDRIVHVPAVGYHWRVHALSAASGIDAKPYAYEAARRALSEHVERVGISASVQHGYGRGVYRLVFPPAPESVALVLPLGERLAADPGLPAALEAFAAGLARPGCERLELIVAGPAHALDRARAAEALGRGGLGSERVRHLEVSSGGPAAAVNAAAQATDAELIAWTDVPVEMVSEDWLDRLAGLCRLPGVAVAGAKVLSCDGRVEHAGIVLGEGLPLPVFHAAPSHGAAPAGQLQASGNFSAVSGLVMARRETLLELGGLEPALGGLAEVDLCLRLRDRRRRVVFAAEAVAQRLVQSPPLNEPAALAALRRRWRRRYGPDPYYNPGYWQRRGDYLVASPWD